MISFHLHLYAKPAKLAEQSGTMNWNGSPIDCWQIEQVEESTMQLTFEQLQQSWMELPRLFFEPDGSFVWRGEILHQMSTNASRWQIDGMVYDHGGKVCRVELHGNCFRQPMIELVQLIQPVDHLIAYCLDSSRFMLMENLLRRWP